VVPNVLLTVSAIPEALAPKALTGAVTPTECLSEVLTVLLIVVPVGRGLVNSMVLTAPSVLIVVVIVTVAVVLTVSAGVNE
jgi:hypothetical protein